MYSVKQKSAVCGVDYMKFTVSHSNRHVQLDSILGRLLMRFLRFPHFSTPNFSHFTTKPRVLLIELERIGRKANENSVERTSNYARQKDVAQNKPQH